MTLLNAAQLVLLGILTLLIGVPAILLALLLPGKALKGKLFLVVSKTYARIALWFFRIQVGGGGSPTSTPGSRTSSCPTTRAPPTLRLSPPSSPTRSTGLSRRSWQRSPSSGRSCSHAGRSWSTVPHPISRRRHWRKRFR